MRSIQCYSTFMFEKCFTSGHEIINLLKTISHPKCIYLIEQSSRNFQEETKFCSNSKRHLQFGNYSTHKNLNLKHLSSCVMNYQCYVSNSLMHQLCSWMTEKLEILRFFPHISRIIPVAKVKNTFWFCRTKWTTQIKM